MENLRALRWIHKPKLADHVYGFPITVDESHHCRAKDLNTKIETKVNFCQQLLNSY